MGTRNLVAVVSNGEFKVAQYGQWDGYPSGQGSTVCEFLQEKLDLEKFKSAVNDCKYLDKDELNQKWATAGADLNNKDGFVTMEVSDKFKRTNPTLSRDAGAEVLEMIQDHGSRELKNSIDFAGDSLFCEWAYVVDLDNNVLEVYKGFNQKPLDPSERFYSHALPTESHRKDYYYPIKLVKKLSFTEATPGAMVALEQELNKDEEE